MLRAWQHYESLRDAARARAGLPPTGATTEAPLLTLDDAVIRAERPLSRSALLKALRIHLRVAGFTDGECRRFSGHSFRRGGAQSLRDAGVQLADIKVAGHWKSDAVLRYFTSQSDMASAFAPFFARAASLHPPRSSVTNGSAAATETPARRSHGDANSLGDGAVTEPDSGSDTSAAATDDHLAPQSLASSVRAAAVWNRTDRDATPGSGPHVFVELEESAVAHWGEEEDAPAGPSEPVRCR